MGEIVTKKNSSKSFRELGASSSQASGNKKLSVTLNILVHEKFCCLKSLLNSKNVLTRKGSKNLFPELWKLSNILEKQYPQLYQKMDHFYNPTFLR